MDAHQQLELDVAELAADEEWKRRAFEAVEKTCRARPEFISDDVWRIGGLPSTREDRALGPILVKARKAGLCEKTAESRPSIRSHRSGKPVWRSLVFGAPSGA